jgi:hypothetical protein
MAPPWLTEVFLVKVLLETVAVALAWIAPPALTEVLLVKVLLETVAV